MVWLLFFFRFQESLIISYDIHSTNFEVNPILVQWINFDNALFFSINSSSSRCVFACATCRARIIGACSYFTVALRWPHAANVYCVIILYHLQEVTPMFAFSAASYFSSILHSASSSWLLCLCEPSTTMRRVVFATSGLTQPYPHGCIVYTSPPLPPLPRQRTLYLCTFFVSELPGQLAARATSFPIVNVHTIAQEIDIVRHVQVYKSSTYILLTF